jgi:glutamine cyclotransferase
MFSRVLFMISLLLCSNFSVVAAQNGSRSPGCDNVHRVEAHYRATVAQKLPHDAQAFTEGFVYHRGVFLESTGLYGRSTVRITDPHTGMVQKCVSLSRDFFGEGLTVWDERIVQLTWKAGKGFVYDASLLTRIKTFRYRGEGWGLTHDGTCLIMSQGTDTLLFLDPVTFKTVRTLNVHGDAGPVWYLNELEFVSGEIFANVWPRDVIVRIDPRSGAVKGWIHLESLVQDQERDRSLQVFNGIAWDAEKNRLFVTLKNWPFIYEIKLKEIKQDETGTERPRIREESDREY